MPRPTRTYQHLLESLESRILLDVTPTEFAQLQSMYPDLGLTEYNDYNIIEIPATNLTDTAIRHAIDEAAITTANDLIVIRTTTTQHKIALDGDALLIYVDATTHGSITIVSLGDEPLTMDAKHHSIIFNINFTPANVSLAGLIMTNGNGGAIRNSGTLTVTHSTITGNNASSSFFGYGGGIYNGTSGILTLTHSTITENNASGSAGASGGGIYNKGTLIVAHSIIAENNAISTRNSSGGGIFSSTALTVTDSIITGNTANSGGGICKTARGVLTVTNTTIAGNTALSGGGISISGGSNTVATMMNSTITGNTASANGGGIRLSSGTLMLTNSLVAENTANDTDSLGGGIYCSYSTLMVTNTTITRNTAFNGGGIYLDGTTRYQALLANSIVVENSSTDIDTMIYSVNGYPGIEAYIISGYNNLTPYANTHSLWTNTDGNRVYNPNQPLFVDADAGDYRLVANAQAIDGGSNLLAYAAGLNENSLDLAGNPRIAGESIDIGAYEYAAEIPSARLPGDANGDGIVDLADLTILARNWKKTGTWSTGDFNGDGFVDLADLTILARNWKKTLNDVASVPTNALSWEAAMASVTFGTPSPSVPASATATMTTPPTTNSQGPLPLNWDAQPQRYRVVLWGFFRDSASPRELFLTTSQESPAKPPQATPPKPPPNTH